MENSTSDQWPGRVSETDLMPNVDTMEVSTVNNGEEGIGTKRSSSLVSRVPRRFPAKLKELLDIGILEDLPVQYIRGSRMRGNGKSGFRGVIKGFRNPHLECSEGLLQSLSTQNVPSTVARSSSNFWAA